MRFKTESQAFDLEAWVKLLGPDLLVVIWGGDRPHLGAVAIARPKPSPKDSPSGSEVSLVFCFPGHRDDVVARAAAERLAEALGRSVTVTAGIHWDHIDADGIQRVIDNGRALIEMIIEKVSEPRSQ